MKEYKIVSRNSIMEQKLETRNCGWRKGCKNKVQVDTHMEGGYLGITVIGWCDFHSKVYRESTKLQQRYCREHYISWPIGSKDYKKYGKALSQLTELAEHRLKNN